MVTASKHKHQARSTSRSRRTSIGLRRASVNVVIHTRVCWEGHVGGACLARRVCCCCPRRADSCAVDNHTRTALRKFRSSTAAPSLVPTDAGRALGRARPALLPESKHGSCNQSSEEMESKFGSDEINARTSLGINARKNLAESFRVASARVGVRGGRCLCVDGGVALGACAESLETRRGAGRVLGLARGDAFAGGR